MRTIGLAARVAPSAMKLRAIATGSTIFLAGCVYDLPVATDADAIAAGKSACAEVMTDMPKDGWKAQDRGDHWRVWRDGDGGDDSWPLIDVPKSGRRVSGDRDCKFIVITD